MDLTCMWVCVGNVGCSCQNLTSFLPKVASSIDLEPCSAKLFSIQIVYKEICGGVETNKKMGQSDDDIDDRMFRRGTVLTKCSQPVADNHLVHVWDNLKRLTEDEQSGHANKNESQLVFLLLFLYEGSSRLPIPIQQPLSQW